MIKRLYTLFSVLLLLASCATEEIEQIEVELNKSKTETLLNAIDIY